MGKVRSSVLVVLFVILIAGELAFVHAQGHGSENNNVANNNDNHSNNNNDNNNNNNNNNNKNGKSKGDDDGGDEGDDDGKKGKGKGKEKEKEDPEETQYQILTPMPGTGQERAFCHAKGHCYYKTLTCPKECPERKPKKNKKQKGCFVNCGSKCEVTCKRRKANCEGHGSLCYDPRFVGGDGVMFYFHGAKGKDFAIISDDNLHINAHLIGSRPQGRTRDFTWVQALAIMFDTHTLTLAAKRVPQWNDTIDALTIRWDDTDVVVPIDGDAEWRNNNNSDDNEDRRELVIERTDETNSVRVMVAGLLELDVRVRPIGEQENKVHNYQLPANDSFAHLETQFKFTGLSDSVEGILGKTYRPGYVSPVKRGVPMPMMGGEDNYQTPSLYSPVCKLCRFQRPSISSKIGDGVAEY